MAEVHKIIVNVVPSVDRELFSRADEPPVVINRQNHNISKKRRSDGRSRQHIIVCTKGGAIESQELVALVLLFGLH